MRMVMFVCSLALLAAAVSRINELQDIRYAPSNAAGVTLGAKAGTLLKEHFPASRKN